jgi:hypothetical protein
MSLTLVTTSGGASSNSYVTEGEATAFFESIPSFYTYWSSTLNSQGRIAWLIQAARGINRMAFLGYKTDEDQSLQFPRDGETTIPAEVKEAQLQMVLYLASNPGLLVSGSSVSVAEPQKTISSVSVPGVVSVSYEIISKTLLSLSQLAVFDGGFDAIQALLRPWLSFGPNSFEFIK